MPHAVEHAGVPPSGTHEREPGLHGVLFHDDDQHFLLHVAQHASDAIDAGGVAVLAATGVHLGAVVAALRPASRERVLSFDAHELLMRLVVQGRIDGDRFRDEIGSVLARAADLAGNAPVHVYGELVDLLWSAGDESGALRLEELWNEIALERSFSLLCGYRRGAHASGVRAIVEQHTHALGQDLSEANRVIAALEAKASHLSHELHRKSGAASRLEGLLAASAELLRHPQLRDVAEIVVDTGIQTLGATNGAMWTMMDDGRTLSLAHAQGYSADVCERLRRIPMEGADLAAQGSAAEAARSKKPLFFESFDEYARRFPRMADAMRPLKTMDAPKIAALPLVVDERVLGVVSFNFDRTTSAADVGDEDRAFLELLARHAAQGLERARLQQSAEDARHAAERAAADAQLLYRVTEAVNRAESVEQIYRIAVDAVRTGAQIDRAAILLFDRSDKMRFVASHGLSDAYRAAVDGHSPWTADAVSPAPITVGDLETDATWASLLPMFRQERIRSVAFVPLVHHAKLIGKLMLYSDVAHRFGEREIGIAVTVASHIAHGVERGRAQEQERAARVAAEEATLAREEILSVVSHDLRNPLGAVMMSAGALLRIDEIGATALDRVKKHAQRVHRNAEAMTRLIDDLIDFSAIRSGRLTLKPGAHAPEAIVRASVDLFQAAVEPRGLRLDSVVEGPLPLLTCDHDRIVQVIANLVSNAIKVTGPGGVVSVTARRVDDEIVFAVDDSGPGIKPDELGRVFDRYWRGSNATYKGTGLGLNIAKEIVEAHGGRIWAESAGTGGSTFSFALPVVVEGRVRV